MLLVSSQCCLLSYAGSQDEVQLMKLILASEGMPSVGVCGNYCLLVPWTISFCWCTIWVVFYPCRSRSRSRSYSPSYSRRHARGSYSEEVHRSKSRTPKVEYITEFGGSGDGDEPKLEGFSPPPSPPAQADLLNRSEHWTFNSCKDRLDSLENTLLPLISILLLEANFSGLG